MNYVLNHVLAL